MRLNVHPIERASALASMVLPTPGTSSRRMCPWDASATSASSASSRFPTITVSTFARIECRTSPGLRNHTLRFHAEPGSPGGVTGRAATPLSPVTLLVLAPAPAGTGLVPTDLLARLDGHAARRIVAVGHRLLQRLRPLRRPIDLHMVDGSHHVEADGRRQLLEEPV